MLGEKVGEGGSSEVFAWGDARVVKLFRAKFAFAAEMEAERAAQVHAAGIASPAVHGLVEVDGRTGVVFDRVAGPTLLDALLRGEQRPAQVGELLAEIHLAMHRVEVPDLPDLAAVLASRGWEVPRGDAVFHGDFHPGNVLLDSEGTCTIDWVNAHRAPRAADVARSVMAIRYQALRADQPARALDRERGVRTAILDAYLDTYRARDADPLDDLDAWLGHAARALLAQEPDSADAALLRDLATASR